MSGSNTTVQTWLAAVLFYKSVRHAQSTLSLEHMLFCTDLESLSPLLSVDVNASLFLLFALNQLKGFCVDNAA